MVASKLYTMLRGACSPSWSSWKCCSQFHQVQSMKTSYDWVIYKTIESALTFLKDAKYRIQVHFWKRFAPSFNTEHLMLHLYADIDRSGTSTALSLLLPTWQLEGVSEALPKHNACRDAGSVTASTRMELSATRRIYFKATEDVKRLKELARPTSLFAQSFRYYGVTIEMMPVRNINHCSLKNYWKFCL